ncbi:MAG: DOMON-like domain-containing protein [Phenylobacterium sp.]
MTEIRVEASRPQSGQLALTYSVVRGPGEPLVPPPAEPARTDGLWRHTCLEAFIRAPDAEPYVELNLSPSGQWAAYRFEAYRHGMAPLDIPPPRIAWRATAEGFELRADIDLAGVADLPLSAAWSLALTAVIEEADGRTSYWALAHAPGKADFHAEAGFALALS